MKTNHTFFLKETLLEGITSSVLSFGNINKKWYVLEGHVL